MWTVVVVVAAPAFDREAGVVQAGEPVLVEALVPELPVEALDKRILYGLAGLDEVELHAVLVGSLIQDAARELRSVVHDKGLRQPRVRARRSRSRTTRLPGIERPTSMATASRLKMLEKENARLKKLEAEPSFDRLG